MLPEREQFFDELHSLMLKARERKMQAHSLGEKDIDGRRAVGYHLKLETYDTRQDIWADVETLLPVRIEITATLPDEARKTSHEGSNEKTSEKKVLKSTWSDIQYNLNLDESLFSLDPPAGYKVVKHKKVVLPKRQKQSEGKSKESVPMNSGTLVKEGEAEEEDAADAKKGKAETKEPLPVNSGTLVPMGEVEKEGAAKAKK